MGHTAETLKYFIKNIGIHLGVINTNSKFTHHLLENGHAFGKMDDIMEIMYFTGKVVWIP
jgi:hypothetical protein